MDSYWILPFCLSSVHFFCSIIRDWSWLSIAHKWKPGWRNTLWNQVVVTSFCSFSDKNSWLAIDSRVIGMSRYHQIVIGYLLRMLEICLKITKDSALRVAFPVSNCTALMATSKVFLSSDIRATIGSHCSGVCWDICQYCHPDHHHRYPDSHHKPLKPAAFGHLSTLSSKPSPSLSGHPFIDLGPAMLGTFILHVCDAISIRIRTPINELDRPI